MNLEAVFEAVDAAVFAKTKKHLSQVERILLEGAWYGRTYEQIAESCQYSLTYLKQAAGPKLWKLLSEALEVEVSKTNFRALLERQLSDVNTERRLQLLPEKYSGQAQSNLGQALEETIPTNMPRSAGTTTKLLSVKKYSEPEQAEIRWEASTKYTSSNHDQRRDWGEAPDDSIFYGRAKELATLEQSIVQERCRLVAIVGMGGIGKTTLSVRCAKQIQDEFEYVIWRSLRHAPPVLEILADLIQSLSGQHKPYLPSNLDDRVALLIDCLHKHRCLLVLDSLDTILRRGDLAGYYRQEHEGYRELLRRIVEMPHQSCLVITSLEKPREIAALSGKTLPVRSLQLTGLQEEAKEIFKQKNLTEASKWGELIQLYRGNPLALKIVATTIQDLFGGNVSEFLKQNTIVFGDIRDILDEQFERLSALETEILYWLATKCKPVSLSKLRADILSPVSASELIEALESLGRRALTERSAEGDALFTIQQPVVTEYIIDQFIKQACEEIRGVAVTNKLDKLEVLRNHTLVNLQEVDEDIKEIQSRLILTPVKDRLQTIFRDEQIIEEQLNKVLSMLQGKSPLAVGYALENVQNLLAKLRVTS